jgi:hypothetical protein
MSSQNSGRAVVVNGSKENASVIAISQSSLKTSTISKTKLLTSLSSQNLFLESNLTIPKHHLKN